MNKIKAWHFLPENGKLANGDGRKVKVGKTYSVKGEIKICEHGLHGSKNILDSLRYAPGFLLERVEIWGDVIEQDDKLVGRHRKCLALIDVKKIVIGAVCYFAERAMKRTGWEDKRSWDAVRTVKKWLKDKATIEEVRTAANAAGAADVANGAAYAANAAAFGAAYAAAYAAANAANAAANAAAVEREYQNRYLTRKIEKAIKEALV